MSKHTRGKWDVDPNNIFAVTADNDGYEVCTTEFFDRAHEECAANARLISAAPELLAACKLALTYASGKPTNGFPVDWLGTLQAAIAKAEGK